MMVMALYILLGTFLDEVSTILITVPMTLPLINSIGYDGIWFGIFVTVMCTIGLITSADRDDGVRDSSAASGYPGRCAFTSARCRSSPPILCWWRY